MGVALATSLLWAGHMEHPLDARFI